MRRPATIMPSAALMTVTIATYDARLCSMSLAMR